MRTIKDASALKNRPCVAALGTFDGVHLGHKKVIGEAVRFAKENKLPSVVVTFDPHPKTIVFPGRREKLLTTIKERAIFIEALNANYLFVCRFTEKLKNTAYGDFAKKILFKKLRVKHVFIGADYLFGRNREGNALKLDALGKRYDFGVTAVKDKTEHRRVVKSTLIRGLLLDGKFRHAVNLLGHPYLISGAVVRGFRRGAALGFPTANLRLDKDKLIPKSGVYACLACFGGKKYRGAVNIGTCPTFGRPRRKRGRHPVSVEAHILGFNRDITGRKIDLYLTKRIRSERKFLRSADLVEAIKHDIAIARKNFVW